MPGVRSIAMKSIELLYSFCKEIGAISPGPHFHNIFIIHPKKFF